MFGLAFYFDDTLVPPLAGNPNGGNWLKIIYLRPHPGGVDGNITQWTCSVWGGAANPFISYIPNNCVEDPVWDYPEG